MKKATILIVDDEVNIVRSLSRVLRDQFNVLTATSGEEALELIAREEIAVILTDQRMPGITGVQLLEHAKRYHPRTVGILISGYSDVGALMDALNLGIVRGYISKPWDVEDLRHRLTEAVQQFEAIFNDTETLHDANSTVEEARTQLAEFRRILDLVTSEQMSSLFARAEDKPLAETSLAPQQLKREYLEHLTDGFGLILASGQIDYWNPAGRQMLGINECLPGDDLCATAHLAACTPLCDAVHAALAGQPAYAEFFLTDTQGKESALEVAATPVPADDGRHNAVLILRDQTQRQQTLAHLKGLSAVSTALGATTSPDTSLELTLAACREATRADGAFVYQQEIPGTTLCLAGATAAATDAQDCLAHHPAHAAAGIVGQVASDGRPQTHLRLPCPELTQQPHTNSGKRISVALAPLRDPEGISGVLGVFTHRLRQFTEADIQLLSAIGSQFGTALHNARLHQQLEKQARTDMLTGLFNRRHFMALAADAYGQARAQGAPLVVLMLDLVRFKQVNDTYGHAVGDRALQAASSALAAHLRGTDLIGRYGGDEFAALLPNCTAGEAQHIIRRLETCVSELQIPSAQGPVPLGVSIGLAAAKYEPSESLDTLLMRADAHMYEVKARVRGQ